MLGQAMKKCEKCGFLHYRTDPCRVAKKSTGARPLRAHSADAQAHGEIEDPKQVQALPVDTPSPELPGSDSKLSGSANRKIAGTGDGSKFDKKAWQREYMRDYMRKRRAVLKS